LGLKDVDVFNHRGMLYVKKKMFDEAINDFTKSINLDPQFCGSYNQRGQAYIYKEMYDEAIEDLNKAILLNNRGRIAYANKALIYIIYKEDI